jgi:hypothetical protein
MKNNMEDFFKENREKFDFSEPKIGHFERFQAKLEGKGPKKKERKGPSWYMLAVAASLLLFFGYWMGNSNVPKGIELADVSPKMEETQNFYVSTIQNEITEIKSKRTTSNQKIIDDAFKQLEILEADYRKLTFELKESNADKRVIYAMITNFQNRLFVLQNLMEQLEEFEQMATPYENKV